MGLHMMPDKRLFLGVRQSATGLIWEHRLNERQEMAAMAIAQTRGVADIVARVLAGRGIGPDDAERFLDPSIRDLLPDPAALTDMEAAAERIARAITGREKVAIFGDYDVDGAAASALLSRFLRHFGVASEIYIPDRLFEGYGPNPEAMRELVERGATLIVTVDCGTNSAASIDAARQAGADVVVLDHHQVGGALPRAVAVVNPNREDDLSGQGHLCGAGVTFLALVQTARVLRSRMPGASQPDLLSLLDLVALATVCDVVPLTGVNRAFVVKGLLAMRRQDNPGLAALARAARIGEPVNAFHLGFLLGPRINAGGRIGDATLGTKLLVTDDPAEANAIAARLSQLNEERRGIEKQTLEAAEAEAFTSLGMEEKGAIVMASGEGWHPGVVGLVAARLKERFQRPALAIAFLGQTGTGSGRSIPGVDLGRAVRAAVEQGLLETGGGHAMAAGLTVSRGKLGELRGFLEEHLRDAVEVARAADHLALDGALTAAAANAELCTTIDRAGPFGAGNPEPVFALAAHNVTYADLVGGAHVRLRLRAGDGSQIGAIAFRAMGRPLGDALLSGRGQPMHVAGTLTRDSWQGQERIEMRILDAAHADPLAAR